MSAYSIAFSPLLPQSALVVLAVAALAAVGLALFARRRGALARALAFALLFLALLDPSLTREDRRPLKDVVAVVIDQSGSQTIGNRAAQTEHARAELEKRLGALDNVETRFIEAGKSDSEEQGTRLFTALQSGLSDMPPDRIGAAILVTDGIVHDIPASAAALGFKAPLHALITGHEGERDRRIELVEAPRFGIVGQDQTISARVFDTADKGEPVAIEVRRDGEKIATLSAMVGQTINAKVRIEHAGPNVVELEVATLPGRADRRQQPRRDHRRGRARQAARAAGVGRAAPGRAHVAQSPEVGRQRRSRSFHHSAAAGKIDRRHADQRTVADRVSRRRPVRAQDSAIST